MHLPSKYLSALGWFHGHALDLDVRGHCLLIKRLKWWGCSPLHCMTSLLLDQLEGYPQQTPRGSVVKHLRESHITTSRTRRTPLRSFSLSFSSLVVMVCYIV